ncbi:MAG: universal stress protein [Acidobacteriia bacterium]|nr:universal stress protein [Terriglobia bacterium]
MKILLAVDESKFSEEALKTVAGQFPPQGTEVRVLHVLQPITLSAPPQMAAGYAPELAAQGVVLEDLRAAGVRGEGMADCQRSLALLAAGKIVAKPIITHHFPLEQMNDALQTFIQRKGGALKVIVEANG